MLKRNERKVFYRACQLFEDDNGDPNFELEDTFANSRDIVEEMTDRVSGDQSSILPDRSPP
jgi:hypothetical protein